MSVIHPKDPTTAFLSALYDGANNTVVITENISRTDLNRRLHHTPKGERILLLGHGSEKGLYWRKDDTRPEYDGIILVHPHSYHLRNHGSNIVALFCNADKFVQAEHLHGLYSGMIISELDEAAEFGIETTEEELESENIKFTGRLRSLLDEKVPLSEIPQRMQQLDNMHSPLAVFNYRRIYFL